MNKLTIVLCAILLCSCAINAQFLSGLTSGQAFTLGLGLPLLLGGLGGGLGGLGGGVGYPIPPPPPPFIHAPMPMVHVCMYIIIFMNHS